MCRQNDGVGDSAAGPLSRGSRRRLIFEAFGLAASSSPTPTAGRPLGCVANHPSGRPNANEELGAGLIGTRFLGFPTCHAPIGCFNWRPPRRGEPGTELCSPLRLGLMATGAPGAVGTFGVL
jgi:hypothetical protein